MPTEITPLKAPLGACVRGTRLKGNINPNDFQTIQQALLDHHLLLLPDQDITEAEQVGFSGLFGELEIHPSKEHRSSVQQEIYRRVSKVRVRVEHSSAGVKVFRSVRDIYRNFKAGFEDTLIETACGLHNLRSDFPIEAWLKAA